MFCDRRNPLCDRRSFSSAALPLPRCANSFRSNRRSKYGQSAGAVKKNCGWWVICLLCCQVYATCLDSAHCDQRSESEFARSPMSASVWSGEGVIRNPPGCCCGPGRPGLGASSLLRSSVASKASPLPSPTMTRTGVPAGRSGRVSKTDQLPVGS
jgi:hypothetical protein